MKIILLVGNTCSGKSTYLKRLSKDGYHCHLSEDTPVTSVTKITNSKLDGFVICESDPQMTVVPDYIIYLRCHPQICFERSTKQLQLEDLIKQHHTCEIMCDNVNTTIPIYKINSQEDQETVYHNLLDILQHMK